MPAAVLLGCDNAGEVQNASASPVAKTPLDDGMEENLMLTRHCRDREPLGVGGEGRVEVGLPFLGASLTGCDPPQSAGLCAGSRLYPHRVISG